MQPLTLLLRQGPPLKGHWLVIHKWLEAAKLGLPWSSRTTKPLTLLWLCHTEPSKFSSRTFMLGGYHLIVEELFYNGGRERLVDKCDLQKLVEGNTICDGVE